MSVYSVQLVIKWLSVCIVSMFSLFNFDSMTGKKMIDLTNNNNTKNINASVEVIPYEVKTSYSSSLAEGKEEIKVVGEEGIAYTNDDGERVVVVREPVATEIVKGTYVPAKTASVSETNNEKANDAIYSGRTTGYGADCTGCSGVVGCKTKNKSRFNLKTNGVYYNDSEYGKVRILSAATDKFPCGTIINVKNGKMDSFDGIVMDSGSTMRNAWKNGNVHIDIAFITQTDSNIVLANSKAAVFEVKRLGW